ncbi:hypothetical protein PoB_005219200 [Plakobranchus ocellatus]|uniref:C2H2-type domain-containing protein n=1 Tax=Plakobranchus ocellatus TaxID=259542 RepID=A0AAV4C2V0_9GAST|nr:hypothetical protein PoB_005219200 [Plakobranchus ocellatus]
MASRELIAKDIELNQVKPLHELEEAGITSGIIGLDHNSLGREPDPSSAHKPHARNEPDSHVIDKQPQTISMTSVVDLTLERSDLEESFQNRQSETTRADYLNTAIKEVANKPANKLFKKGFKKSTKLKKHTQIHKGEFQCHICEKSFSYKALLRMHLDFHRSDSVFIKNRNSTTIESNGTWIEEASLKSLKGETFEPHDHKESLGQSLDNPEMQSIEGGRKSLGQSLDTLEMQSIEGGRESLSQSLDTLEMQSLEGGRKSLGQSLDTLEMQSIEGGRKSLGQSLDTLEMQSIEGGRKSQGQSLDTHEMQSIEGGRKSLDQSLDTLEMQSIEGGRKNTLEMQSIEGGRKIQGQSLDTLEMQSIEGGRKSQGQSLDTLEMQSIEGGRESLSQNLDAVKIQFKR